MNISIKLDDDIEELINDNELIEINKFAKIEEIFSDESISIYRNTEYEISNKDEWDRRREK
mgnify:CR=1 FL=1